MTVCLTRSWVQNLQRKGLTSLTIASLCLGIHKVVPICNRSVPNILISGLRLSKKAFVNPPLWCSHKCCGANNDGQWCYWLPRHSDWLWILGCCIALIILSMSRLLWCALLKFQQNRPTKKSSVSVQRRLQMKVWASVRIMTLPSTSPQLICYSWWTSHLIKLISSLLSKTFKNCISVQDTGSNQPLVAERLKLGLLMMKIEHTLSQIVSG